VCRSVSCSAGLAAGAVTPGAPCALRAAPFEPGSGCGARGGARSELVPSHVDSPLESLGIANEESASENSASNGDRRLKLWTVFPQPRSSSSTRAPSSTSAPTSSPEINSQKMGDMVLTAAAQRRATDRSPRPRASLSTHTLGEIKSLGPDPASGLSANHEATGVRHGTDGMEP
jgi:hypothetical protein